MQKTPLIQHDPVALDPSFPIRAPGPETLHSPSAGPTEFMHYHDAPEIGVCRRGSGIFYIGGGIHAFSAGDVSVIAAGVPHIAQSDREDPSGWQFLDFSPAGLLGGEHGTLIAEASRFSGILHAGKDGGVRVLTDLLLEACADAGPYRRERAAWLIGLILTALASMGAQQESAAPELLSKVSPAVAYISAHYDQSFTVEQLAALCSRSVTGFRRSFTSATGRTPFEYLYEVRVKAAVNLLRNTDMPVSEIAGRVGYDTLSSFNRHFRRIAGAAPSEIRRGRG